MESRVQRLEERIQECLREKEDLMYEIDGLNRQIRELREYNDMIIERWDKDRSDLVENLKKYGKMLDTNNELRDYNINLYAENMALKLNQIILLSQKEKEYICESSEISIEEMEQFLKKFNDLRLNYLNLHRPQ